MGSEEYFLQEAMLKAVVEAAFEATALCFGRVRVTVGDSEFANGEAVQRIHENLVRAFQLYDQYQTAIGRPLMKEANDLLSMADGDWARHIAAEATLTANCRLAAESLDEWRTTEGVRKTLTAEAQQQLNDIADMAKFFMGQERSLFPADAKALFDTLSAKFLQRVENPRWQHVFEDLRRWVPENGLDATRAN
jgi:hypothetical protein